jgi:hypothetical protein
MQRLMLVVLLAASCGGKSKPPTTPLPPDNPPVAEEQKPAEEKPAEEKPAPPPIPAGPVEAKIPATTATVKLVSPGKGKREALKYTAKAGKQTVELAMDFTYQQTVQGQSKKQTTPTLVLAGAAETKGVDKDGNADFTLTVASADVRPVEGAVPADKFKEQLGSLSGMTVSGNVGANGAAKETLLHIEKPDQFSAGALDLLSLALPLFPLLPKEPVGVGAKWQTTVQSKVGDDGPNVTQITDYELVAHKGTAWTIKTTTKVTGAEQDLHGAKISKIDGTGAGEITLTDGALYPTTKQTVETKFTATDTNPQSPMSIDFSMKIGSAITAK